MESVKVAPHVKKPKKKQVKDELDRIKQAEKKRRRLEKALATSAAIRSELERKKQLKKEEQQRLDEEGAAIAEAVALHVLLGEDSDSDDGSAIIMKNDRDYHNNWHHAPNLGFFVDGRCSFESMGYWNRYEESNKSFSTLAIDNGGWNSNDISAGVIAAQVLASLQIGGDDARVDPVLFNGY